MEYTECSHIEVILGDPNKKDTLLKKYKSIVSWHPTRTSILRNSAKRRKIAAPTCGTCDTTLTRPFACLECSYTGCWTDQHILRHLDNQRHKFCVDAKSGSIYCTECNDFVYDRTLDTIRSATVLHTEEKTTRFQVSRMLRESYAPWAPNDAEASILGETTTIPCQGRRGLLNLGQTCFMNVVLQCLVHNPLVRNYFLSDKHNRKQCKSEVCTCCELDKLFEEVYSEDCTPYGPINFLATTWKTSSELSGYSQQDAHEFFICALNQIHSTSRGSTNVSCNCVIHSTFSGQLQSDVKCERCGNVTSTVDPMMDVSLDITKVTTTAINGRSGTPRMTGAGAAMEGSGNENTLAACLKRFTQHEKLGVKDYSCSKCGKTHEASKRLSIRKLPPVLVFQLKRFEHKTIDKSSARKIDAQIRFPAIINMSPYTSAVVKDMEKESAGTKSGIGLTGPGPDALYEYELFAVINHEGQIDNGHYTNFARFKDEWYRFDDDKVTHSSLSACLQSSAYMLFYVKRHLDYKPYVIPSYVRMRETEAAREKERELEKERGREREKERERERRREREKELEDDLLSML